MILLLDAHALVWWLDDDRALSQEARSAVADPTNEVVVSAASVWELAIKRAKGKIELPADLAEAVAEAGFSSLPITPGDAEAAAALPAHHGDPFDRMLIAQAARVDALIVTRDRVFEAYGVSVIPA